jgi:hypothetical protein
MHTAIPIQNILHAIINNKGKVHSPTGHAGPDREQRYNYSFFNLGAR